MAELTTPEFRELLTRVDELECSVAELRESVDAAGGVNASNVMLLPGLVVYYPDDDHGNVVVVAANSRRLPTVSVPARPTVREWAGVLHHCRQWPDGIAADRAENLLLRVIDPHLDGMPIDLLDTSLIMQAVTAARLTDDERTTVQQLLEFAVAEAVRQSKAPAM